MELETCQKGCRKRGRQVTDSANTTAALQAMLEPQGFVTKMLALRLGRQADAAQQILEALDEP